MFTSIFGATVTGWGRGEFSCTAVYVVLFSESLIFVYMFVVLRYLSQSSGIHLCKNMFIVSNLKLFM